MGVSKSAFSRYRIIDKMLKNTFRPFPSLVDIQEACLQRLDFSPSLDTLEKDIRNMKQSDVFEAPIIYCRTNKGYYYSNPNYSINSIPLTDDDILTIKESLELIINLSGSNRINERFSNAIQKILVAYKEEFPDGNIQRKIIQTDYVDGAKGYENFNVLLESCKNQFPISFVYYSYSKRIFNPVIVHPIRLKEFDNKWYLIGFSENHNSIRTFGLDRIYEPLQLKRKFITCTENEIESYCNDIYGVYPIDNREKQEITFLTSIDVTNYFEAYPIHPSQRAEKNSTGSSFFIINVVPSIELIRLFRSYGKHLEVINPNWLRLETQSLK